MRVRRNWTSAARRGRARLLALAGVLGCLGGLVMPDRAAAEERKFAVMLAHSPKSFVDATTGAAGLPPGGLGNVATINKEYFDTDPSNDVDSFAEYWAEISYGDVTVSGRTFGWITLPWVFEPTPPNAPARNSPANFINHHRGLMISEGPGAPTVPEPFAYGAGEEFCDSFSSMDTDADVVSTNGCGALIIIDTVADTPMAPPPARGPGMPDAAVAGFNVWTPGERFLDLDKDNRWDGLDEKNDRMCHGPDGCASVCAVSVCSLNPAVVCSATFPCAGGLGTCVFGGRCSATTATTCLSSTDCPVGETCVFNGASDAPCTADGDCTLPETCGDPVGSGPRGCNVNGCGDLAMPSVDFDMDGQLTNETNCVVPDSFTPGAQTNCVARGTMLPPCCDAGSTTTPAGCIALNPGVVDQGLQCGDPIICCEFSDVDGDQTVDAAEPFEDFMVRWEPSGATPASVWVRVTEKYVRNNYPGDVDALIRRTGNGYYDSPDLFVDTPDPNAATNTTTPISPISTKMMQDAGVNRFAWRTPKPGTKYAGAPINEEAWFDQWWQDRYSTQATAPPWPGGTSANPPPNSPTMRAFDPLNPVPPVVGATAPANDEAGTRWFQPNRGGWQGNGRGTAGDPNLRLDLGTDDPPTDSRVLPEAQFGYYDGWVEHDDLPSSKYHLEGDKRLGEVTSPSTDTVFIPNGAGPYTAIFGADLGRHSPNSLGTPDTFCVAAGPYATKIHGEKGFDAGDVCIVEWLTWRRDGTSPTVGYQWEIDNGPYHPFAGPRGNKRCTRTGFPCNVDADCAAPVCLASGRCSNSGAACTVAADCPTDVCTFLGFRDYNLDGMIDQGEVRPELSENYSVDSDPSTVNDGTHTNYPFNRRRMVEDVVEALDPSVDWDEFIDAASMRAVLCALNRDVTSVSPFVFDPSHPPVRVCASDGVTTCTVDADCPAAGDTCNPQDRVCASNVATTCTVDADCPAGDTCVLGFGKFVAPEGFVSGIVLIPPGSYNNVNRFPLSPGFYPIHNEDNDDPAFMFPDWPTDPLSANPVHKSWNLHFHDLAICQDCRSPAPAVTPYAAHEYGHAWEGWPDLYDYDIFGNGVDEFNCPIGAWDLMAGSGRGGAALVHSIPILKEQTCTEWIRPVDLTTVVTPGVETTITLPPAELVRDGSYLFLQNEDRPNEKYWFWSAGSGFDTRLPGPGMVILHTDIQANVEGLPLQQRTAPWTYLIVQADGRDDLQACSSGGNDGDASDPWPGTSGATKFGFRTDPPAVWNISDSSWTGLDVTNIVPDGNGSTRVTLTWTPTNIPSLRFINPPGGETVNSIFQIRFDATDAFAGTTIQLFATQKEGVLSFGANGATKIGEVQKTTPDTVQMSFDWDVSNPPIADGRYFIFAKLIPGPGRDGQTERKFTTPRPGPTNQGEGSLTVTKVSIDDDALDSDDKARSETWKAVCIDPNGQDWLVTSSLSQPEPPDGQAAPDGMIARTGSTYTSMGGEVSFVISRTSNSSTPFTTGDSFTFTTTGFTAFSQGVVVSSQEITEGPTPVIDASPLSGPPPLQVDFDARRSTDPNGEPLEFSWDFGDGSPMASGDRVTHTYTDADTFTAILTATNERTGRFAETTVDIVVVNNSPKAVIRAEPKSGPAPLTVRFSGTDSTDTETPAQELVFQWDFGDGQTANDAGQPGTLQEPDHFYENREDGTPCTSANPCTFIAELTVTDAGGISDTASVTILVGNTRPVPDVTATPLTGPAPLSVLFNAINTVDADGDALTVDWNWDDGNSDLDVPIGGTDGTGVIAHVYTDPGTYQPTAVVTDENGASATWPGVTIEVTGNRKPIADFRVTPTRGIAGATAFQFDGRASADSDGSIVLYEWDFDDGQTESGADKRTVTHVFRDENPTGYAVKLTVTDDRGATDSETRTVPVDRNPGNRGPVAHIATLPPSCAAPCTLTFDGTLSFDPDENALSVTWSIERDGTALRIRSDNNGNWLAVDATNPIGASLFRCPGSQRSLCSAKWGFPLPDSIPPGTEDVFLLSSTAPDGMTLPLVIRSPGTYRVALTVTDTQGATDTSNPTEVVVGVAPSGGSTVGLTEPEPGAAIPDSARQRPAGVCGVGMIFSFLGSILGLTLIRTSRRRRRF